MVDHDTEPLTPKQIASRKHYRESMRTIAVAAEAEYQRTLMGDSVIEPDEMQEKLEVVRTTAVAAKDEIQTITGRMEA